MQICGVLTFERVLCRVILCEGGSDLLIEHGSVELYSQLITIAPFYNNIIVVSSKGTGYYPGDIFGT